jgi:type I restriction enzyme S subunit
MYPVVIIVFFNSGGAKFLPGDTLFARITPCLENGKIAQYKCSENTPAFGSTEFFVFRARTGVSDPSYVYYLSLSDLVRGPAEKSMSGASGRQRASLQSIVDIQLPAPPLPTQLKIAAILSAYDDLIEKQPTADKDTRRDGAEPLSRVVCEVPVPRL